MLTIPGITATEWAPSFRPRVQIRALAPGEERPVAEVFNGLSARSRYLRFHTPMRRLPDPLLRRLVATQPDHHVVLVAYVAGFPVGIARWIRRDDHPAQAEIAAEVIDSHQRQGIGRALMKEIAATALNAGINEFVLYVHVSNRVLHDWLLTLGAIPSLDDAEELHLDVQALAPRSGTPRASKW